MEEQKEKFRRFREWQKQPHQVKPLSQEEHVCPTCGTRFEGNYCPRCGQSAMIGRYSFKKAFLLFLDVWGLGNRGMFRTIRDLILRPGYMIRDYLRGMQMAYFPPFKLFFLLVALSLLVETGMNIKGINRIEEQKEQLEKTLVNTLEEKNMIDEKTVDLEEAQNIEKTDAFFQNSSIGFQDWINNHMSIATMIALLLISGPLFLMFRRCPAIPDLRFSEFFVAMVYITNMVTIYGLFVGFFCLSFWIELYLYILILIPLKQLTGYSYWQVIYKTLIALILFIILFVVFFFLTGIIGFALHLR